MYFSTIFIFAALPFLVEAVPFFWNSPRSDRLISIPLTKRSTHLNRDGSVDPRKLQANVHRTITKLDRGFRSYERNTGGPHPLALKRQHSNERRLGSSLSLIDSNNALWIADIAVGTPAVGFTVEIDTSTADLFLPGISCSNCGGHNLYNPQKSSSAINSDMNATINFSDNSVAVGNVFSDNVFVGVAEAIKQRFLVVSSYGTDFQTGKFPADGVLGMGFKEASVFNSKSFFETVASQDGFFPVVGLFLDLSDPELFIGGTDTDKFTGDLTFVDIDRKGFWQIPINYISVNGTAISSDLTDALIDSGSASILGDFKSISNIYSRIPGSVQSPQSGLWTVPCNSTVFVEIHICGKPFSISPYTYVLGPVQDSTSTCLGGFSASANGLGTAFLVLGDVFLRNVYTEFDYANFRVGLAPIRREGNGTIARAPPSQATSQVTPL